MRIGILTESYEPITNGVAVSVRTLIDELRARHHHVIAIAPHFPDHIDSSAFVLRVPSVLTTLNAEYPFPYPWFPRLKRDIRRLNLDILHSQSPFFMGILAMRMSRRYGIPHVSTYHTLYEQYIHYVFFMPGLVTQRLIDWWLPRFYNDCACAIVPSRVAEQNLRRYGVTCRVEVIPTGIPIPAPESTDETTTREIRERWRIPVTSSLLLYVGRLAREKNVELILDSFEEIASEFPDARLLIVGGGPHAETLKSRAQSAESRERIHFAGPTPRHELDSIYAAADVLVFGSATETQGLVVAEARAAGTPAIVVDQGGALETVTHGEDGLVVRANQGEFADAIRKLLKYDNVRRGMRAACLRNAHRYTPSAMADRVIEVYNSLVQAKPVAAVTEI